MRQLKVKEKYLPFVTLPIILSVCLALWIAIGSHTNLVEVQSAGGVWDLTGIDFSKVSVRILGTVEYIPNALLTPEEFAARADEIQVGNPQDAAVYSTSRMRLVMPDDATYTIAGPSIDFSDRIYINGKLMAEIGRPGETKETTVPDTASVSLTDEPVNGVIEIVQQTATFVHREPGWHDGYRVGYADPAATHDQPSATLLVMGCFLALFLVHLTLYFILRSYRANLFFSLFCLTWFFRTGVTGAKVFSSMFPALAWIVKFRIEYLALPVTAILAMQMLRELYPGVLPNWFRRTVNLISAAFIAAFLLADPLLMSWAMIPCYVYLCAAILFILIRMAMKLRSITASQAVSLAGLVLFLYAGIRDMFFYSDIILPPSLSVDLSQVSMLVFVFFQMTSMFMGTLSSAEEARALEERMTAENAALDRLNHMKSDLIATISHETRTPLAVLSGYVWLISTELRSQNVNPQMAEDLDRVADETQRIAAIMEEMQSLSKTRDRAEREEMVDVPEIIRQTARLYEPIVARSGTAIAIDAPDGLPRVRANADEVTQVLFNLLANAKKHTHSGEIRISAEPLGECVSVSVADTGDGMRAEFIPHAFERGSHDDPDGTGIGLAICREIVTAYGGTIDIASALGKGTTVTFALPIGKAEVS